MEYKKLAQYTHQPYITSSFLVYMMFFLWEHYRKVDWFYDNALGYIIVFYSIYIKLQKRFTYFLQDILPLM